MCVCVCVSQPRDSAELSCSVRALQQDVEDLKRVNASLQKENHSLREQLSAARSGNSSTGPLRTETAFPHAVCSIVCVSGGEAHARSTRPSCDAEFARSLKVFYHSMTSVRAELQRLRRHRPSVSPRACLRSSCGLRRDHTCRVNHQEQGWLQLQNKRLSQIKMKLEDFHFFFSLDAVSLPWNVNRNFNHKNWTLVGYLLKIIIIKKTPVFQQFCYSIKKCPFKYSSSAPLMICSSLSLALVVVHV